LRIHPVYIFDIDGTLADCSHRLHHIQKQPKDWRAYFAECRGDAPIQHVIDLLLTIWDAGNDIVYVSGRSDECREDTLNWLLTHGLPEAPLYMRKAGDHRDDDILKAEILEQVIADGYKPVMAFDDRDRVVAMWRSKGVPCCQVAPGNF
jgi:predicted secreted acid phosphatase